MRMSKANHLLSQGSSVAAKSGGLLDSDDSFEFPVIGEVGGGFEWPTAVAPEMARAVSSATRNEQGAPSGRQNGEPAGLAEYLSLTMNSFLRKNGRPKWSPRVSLKRN